MWVYPQKKKSLMKHVRLSEGETKEGTVRQRDSRPYVQPQLQLFRVWHGSVQWAQLGHPRQLSLHLDRPAHATWILMRVTPIFHKKMRQAVEWRALVFQNIEVRLEVGQMVF